VGGDVITHIDGSAIRTLDDFRFNLTNKQIGDTVEFGLVSANGDERTVNAILEAGPA
jgi:S1-C subfamily serine protease